MLCCVCLHAEHTSHRLTCAWADRAGVLADNFSVSGKCPCGPAKKKKTKDAAVDEGTKEPVESKGQCKKHKDCTKTEFCEDVLAAMAGKGRGAERARSRFDAPFQLRYHVEVLYF